MMPDTSANPRLSVITPTLNLINEGRDATFREMLASVQAQTYQDVEHVIVDGASQDGTVDLLNSLEENGQISRYVSEADGGIYAAMNRGAQLATGDFILYLNSDDFYHRAGGLADIAEAAATGVDFICSPVKMLYDPPNIYRVSPRYMRILMRIPFGHPGMAVRRARFLELGGFDESFRISADYDLMMRLVATGAPSALVQDDFVSYRPGGASGDAARRLDERVRMLKKNFDDVCEISAEEWRTALTVERLPARFLCAMLASSRTKWHMKMIALYQLVRTLRPKRREAA